MERFPACDGALLRQGQAQCVFTEASANRLGDRQPGPTRCIKHGHIVCDFIDAESVQDARKKARKLAKVVR